MDSYAAREEEMQSPRVTSTPWSSSSTLCVNINELRTEKLQLTSGLPGCLFGDGIYEDTETQQVLCPGTEEQAHPAANSCLRIRYCDGSRVPTIAFHRQ